MKPIFKLTYCHEIIMSIVKSSSTTRALPNTRIISFCSEAQNHAYIPSFHFISLSKLYITHCSIFISFTMPTLKSQTMQMLSSYMPNSESLFVYPNMFLSTTFKHGNPNHAFNNIHTETHLLNICRSRCFRFAFASMLFFVTPCYPYHTDSVALLAPRK